MCRLAGRGRAHHRRATRDPYDVILMFCAGHAGPRRSRALAVERTAVDGALWIAWPKKPSGVATDLTEDVIRQHALGNRPLDVMACAIDEVWSGLTLARRLADR